MSFDIQRFFDRINNPYVVAISFVTAVGIMVAFQMVMLPRFSELTGGGVIFDMQTGYSPQQAYEIVRDYGESGRTYYSSIQLIDILFPIAYGLSFASMIIFSFSRAFPGRDWLLYLACAPLLTVLFDYTEGVGIFVMLHSYPETFDNAAVFTNVLTLLKSYFYQLSMLLALVGLASLAIRQIMRKRR